MEKSKFFEVDSKLKIAILISGRGSNMIAIAQAVVAGVIPNTEIAVVISNKKDVDGISRAAAMGLNVAVIERNGRSREDHDREIVSVLEKHEVELVCLAGYMRLLSPYFINSFRNRIVNIHPSLLPSFPGTDAVKQAFGYGVKVTGCTVHFVDEELDHGPIIEQTPIPVREDDDEASLSARILEAEHQTYILAIKRIAESGLKLDGRKVKDDK